VFSDLYIYYGVIIMLYFGQGSTFCGFDVDGN
jgi:hypothetical protein